MLRLYHDYTSPAAALAVLRLQRLVDEGCEVEFAGIDVLGLDRPVPATLLLLDELDAHRDQLIEAGLDVRRPDRQPPTLRAHVVAGHASDVGLSAAWRLGCYRAFFEDGAALSDPDVLIDLAGGMGLDAGRVAELLADPAAARGLRARMAGYRREGVGGVPVLEADGAFVPGLLDESDLRELASL